MTEKEKKPTWELVNVATEHQKMFHNRETDETCDDFQLLLKIINDIHDMKISMG